MPIYGWKCNRCGVTMETYTAIGGDTPIHCGEPMSKMPSFPAMVKVKGDGGYPSRRKEARGTAPYSRG